MKTQTALSEDSSSTSLNSGAHAVEHCAVDPSTLEALGSALGRQVLIRRSPRRLALYTVTELVSAPSSAVHVGTEGLARLGDADDAPLEGEADATIETDFTGGDSQGPARLTEELLGDAATGLAILAPHGGRIEVGTDDQADAVYGLLAPQAKPVQAWIAHGFNRATGARTCWHITSSEISELSFPQLGTLFGPEGSGQTFAHAVAFHGNNDSEAVVVGGGLPADEAQTELKGKLAARIHDALGAVTPDPPPVEVSLYGPLAGALRANIVNRVTERGNGVQIEQPLAVREDVEQRDAIARAVAELYADLI